MSKTSYTTMREDDILIYVSTKDGGIDLVVDDDTVTLVMQRKEEGESLYLEERYVFSLETLKPA